MLGRGKTPLKKRKIQVERGKEIDAIWEKTTMNKLVTQTPKKKPKTKG
jgi:hypothetical protein